MATPGPCTCYDPMIYGVGIAVFPWLAPTTVNPITTYELTIVQSGIPTRILNVPAENEFTSYEAKELLPGIVVNASVKASCDGGTSWGPTTSFSPAIPINIPVDPPTSITATMDPDTQNVTVTWTAPAVKPLGLAHFYVESVANNPYVPVYGCNTADLSVFTYTFTELNRGFSYYFQVRVVNNAGQSPVTKTTDPIYLYMDLIQRI
jgi:hypothetical protein